MAVLLTPKLHGMQGRSESSEWQDKWQQAVKELADVKERAWSLLEEKDLQLQSLKVTSLPLLHVGHGALLAISRMQYHPRAVIYWADEVQCTAQGLCACMRSVGS